MHFIVIALIVAAAAATASVGIKAATTGDIGSANDAFGDWLKTFFISFAANSVGGAAGAAGEAGGETMTASEIAMAEKAGAANQLVPASTNLATSGATNTASSFASLPAEGAEMAEIAAAEGLDVGGPFADQAAGIPNTTGANIPGWTEPGGLLDSITSGMSNASPTENILKWLGIDKPAYMEETKAATDAVEMVDGYGDQQRAFEEQAQKDFNLRRALGLSEGGFGPAQKQGLIAANEWEDADQAAQFKRKNQSYGGFTGGGNFDETSDFDDSKMGDSIFGTKNSFGAIGGKSGEYDSLVAKMLGLTEEDSFAEDYFDQSESGVFA